MATSIDPAEAPDVLAVEFDKKRATIWNVVLPAATVPKAVERNYSSAAD
jgi:hypothetical protein